MNWIYKGKSIESHYDIPKEITHMVYELSFTDKTKYIGFKTLRTTKELPPLKNGNKRENHICIKGRNKNGKRVYMEIIGIDSSFVDYEGSSEENKGRILISKDILYFTTNKRTATYLEAKLLFSRGVLEDDKYNNKNINRRWFDNCLDGLYKEHIK